MGFFDIFKKSYKYELPKIYEGLVTKKEYNTIFEECVKYHKNNNLKILEIQGGQITTEKETQERVIPLDDLITLLTGSQKEDWNTLLCEYFDKIYLAMAKEDELYENFSYAKHLLRVSIEKDSFADKDDYIYRDDLPGTLTFLTMQIEGNFKYLKREEIRTWEKEDHELFTHAIKNSSLAEVTKYNIDNKFPTFAFFSKEPSASLILDLKNRADYTIGRYGSLVCIPTKGTTFAHPIQDRSVLELLPILSPEIQSFYQEDPEAISTNFYWYYEGKFYLFPTIKEEISYPDKLEELFEAE